VDDGVEEEHGAREQVEPTFRAVVREQAQDQLCGAEYREGPERPTAPGRRVDRDLGDLPRAVSLAAYRVAQESLTNALKHGGPGSRTVLEIERTAVDVRVLVVNDVRVGQPPVEGSGQGLVGMGERVSAVGGRLSAGPEGGRWRVEAVLPIPTEQTP
jgi:two-component sensor histidine kinase